MRRVLLVHSGPTFPSLVGRFGDFDRWFMRALEPLPIAWTVVRPFTGEPLPAPAGYDAVLMTGSLASITDRAPWMLDAERWVRHAVEGGTAFLGVCFGHQLLAHAFGARVVKNPRGIELGTVEIELTDEGRDDPLFEELPERLRVHETHEDMVVDLPAGVQRLAGNSWTPVQAIAVGDRARGVQFHPEMTEELLGAAARELGLHPASLGPAPDGARVLRAFLERVAPPLC